MKIIIILALCAFITQAAEAPVLTTEQKLVVREAQLAVLDNRAAIAEAESKLKDLYQQRPVLQEKFNKLIIDSTPEGFKMQPDLTLVACKWAEEPGCGTKAK